MTELTETEMAVMEAMFLAGRPLTEDEIAERTGIPLETVLETLRGLQ